MANEKGKKRISLLSKLTFAPENRSADAPRPVIEGRFRYFFSLFKQKNNELMVANLFFLIFCLPLLVVLILPRVFGGMENISYLLAKITEKPYFMGNIGIGLSSQQSITEAQIAILNVHRLHYLLIAATLPILAIGASGLFHVAMKLVWQDKFITKKDSYGNNVPRISVEFFIGVKKYALQFVLIFLIFALIFAAVSCSVIFFIQNLWQNTAGAGLWILLIVALIFALFAAAMLVFMLPMLKMYEIPLAAKLKNSVILIISTPLPVFFITAVSLLPFVLVSVSSGFIQLILIAALLIFGGGFYSLMWSNFVQYYADKIITPVYESQINKGQKKKKKNKK